MEKENGTLELSGSLSGTRLSKKLFCIFTKIHFIVPEGTKRTQRSLNPL